MAFATSGSAADPSSDPSGVEARMEGMVNSLEFLLEESLKMQDATVRLQNRVAVMYGQLGAARLESDQMWTSLLEDLEGEDPADDRGEGEVTTPQQERVGETGNANKE